VDIHPGNNRAEASVHLGMRAPIIVTPANGTTCLTFGDVQGLATPGVTVELFLDGVLAGATVAGPGGRWTIPVGPVADGTHTLYAVAKQGAESSPLSPTTTVIVNSSLAWSPLSLRFTDSRGHSHRPVDEQGRTDENGWRIRLRRSETYTVSLRVCCEDPGVIKLVIDDTQEVILNDVDGDQIYEGSFTTPTDRQQWRFAINVECSGSSSTATGAVLIDPEGNVYDSKTGALIAGANVQCQEAQTVAAADGSTNTIFALWDAAEYGQINPQTTAADGYFNFFTPVGAYRLEVAKTGYQPYRSTDIAVVDEAVRYDVPLTPQLDEAATTRILITENGFEPSYVEVTPGSVVEWVNVDVDGHTSTFLEAAAALAAGAGAAWDSGLLLANDSYKLRFDSAGMYNYGDSANAFNTAMIVVKEQVSPPDGTETQQIFLPVVSR
jgi:plastocyanin